MSTKSNCGIALFWHSDITLGQELQMSIKLNPSIALFWHSIALENPTFVIQAFKALLGKSNIGHSFKIKPAPRLEALRKPPPDILVSKIGGLAHSIHCDKLFIIIRDCSQKMESNDYLKSLPTCDRSNSFRN